MKKRNIINSILIIIATFAGSNSAIAKTAMEVITDGLEPNTAAKNVPYDYVIDSLIGDRAKRSGTQTQCDVLTANKRDPQRKAYPVKFGDIKATDAISACRKALKNDPKNPRLMLNIGRAFNVLKIYKESYAWTKKAMELDYPYAYRVMALHYEYGEGVEDNGHNLEERIRLLKIAINKDIDSAAEDYAFIELNQSVPHIDFVKVDELIEKAGYYQDRTSSLWGRYYHQKSKVFMQDRFFMNWRELLEANDVDAIITRLNPAEEREYLNLITNSLEHYSDYLATNKDKEISKTVNKLERHKRYYVSELESQ